MHIHKLYSNYLNDLGNLSDTLTSLEQPESCRWPPRAWVGPTPQPDTVAKSKAAIPWRFMVVEPNPSYTCHWNHPQTGKRHVHPEPARQPLMLVNSKKSGHLVQDCGKDWTNKSSVLHHKPLEPAFHNNHNQIWVSKVALYLFHTFAAFPRARGILHRQDKPNPKQVTPTRDTYLRPRQIYPSYRDEATARSQGSRTGAVHYYRVFCRQQEQDVTSKVSLHIQNRSLRQA